MRVALFATCLVDGLLPDVGKATDMVLRRLAAEVEFPPRQTLRADAREYRVSGRGAAAGA